MPLPSRRALVLALALCASVAPARAEDAAAAAEGFAATPPRVAFRDGEVWFWRPGAEAWTAALVNTALAPGDALHAGAGANLELQVGPHSFVRAGEHTRLTLVGLEDERVELHLERGTLALDVREPGRVAAHRLETPHAVLRVERSGAYRAAVTAETTTLTARRGGQASVALLGAEPMLASGAELVVTGGDAPRVESRAAPALDAWDRWNEARGVEALGALSARYLPAGVYGAHDLDLHGAWQLVPPYGPVWVPRHVGVGWAPYSVGRWLWDRWYAWTWVDGAPWGWAPFHHGRWVYVAGHWAWCPGPLVPPYYSPALVAFGRGVTRGVGGGPASGWVALGFGEPLVPWWGPPGFRRRAHWMGWGGPRVVNGVPLRRGAVVGAADVRLHGNAGVAGAFVQGPRDRLGRALGPHRVPVGRTRPGVLGPARGVGVGPAAPAFPGRSVPPGRLSPGLSPSRGIAR